MENDLNKLTEKEIREKVLKCVKEYRNRMLEKTIDEISGIVIKEFGFLHVNIVNSVLISSMFSFAFAVLDSIEKKEKFKIINDVLIKLNEIRHN